MDDIAVIYIKLSPEGINQKTSFNRRTQMKGFIQFTGSRPHLNGPCPFSCNYLRGGGGGKLLENLTVAQLVKKIAALYGTRM
jgi:hypothetical protein